MTKHEFDPSKYQWKPQPAAAGLIQQHVETACRETPWAQAFAQRLHHETGTRLVDWLDHIAIADVATAADVGFTARDTGQIWEHQAGLFPSLVIDEQLGPAPRLAIQVASVDRFLDVHADEIENCELRGDPGSALRIATFQPKGGGSFCAVERHGHRGFHEKVAIDATTLESALEQFRQRPRSLTDPADGFKKANEIFKSVAAVIGRDWACDLFFRSEREYWQSRNHAARTQYARQDKLGLGWANHDHHTYRCSREWFAALIEFLELTGFACRERFYAGSDAGWGAQVLEHAACGVVIFADVDMTEAEVSGDFAHQGLPSRDHMGTVGLWCRLHGDSFLAAGMHHLECQFDFDAARAQLKELGVKTMAPFTDFPYLKQAFTKGELWKLDLQQLQPLVQSGAISSDDAKRFASEGALGSHMEILERNDGFKGFNQTGISKIILETNPRNA